MDNRQTRVSRRMADTEPATQKTANITTNQNRISQNTNQTIDLLEYFFRLVHAWKSLLMAFLVGAALLGAYHTFFLKPTYRATTEIYITNTETLISLSDLQLGSALTEDYQSIIKSRIVLNRVIEQLHLNTDYRALGKMISVNNPNGTHIIHTSVTTGNLELSRDIANALLNISIERIYQIIGTGEPTVIDYSEAQAVENIMPGFGGYILRGGLIGIVLVAAFIMIQMMTDTTLKNDEDVEKYLQLPVLAAVPYFKD